MSKVYKRKRRSCAMCKPHKTGWAPRMTAKQWALRKTAEADIREAK